MLTLCGKADLKKAAYEISLDAVPPLFSDADRNGDGTVDRHDFCAQTRDAVSGLDAGRPVGVGTATLVPGAGGAPDQVWFSVPVDAIAPDLPRDGRTRVYAWVETRQNANAAAPPTAYVVNRNVVDRLPVPDPTDGCALPQAAGEALSVTLTEPATPKTVFVSSQTYDGNLGGLAGADAKCQGLADAAGLKGTFKALLLDSWPSLFHSSCRTCCPTAQWSRTTGPTSRTANCNTLSTWTSIEI